MTNRLLARALFLSTLIVALIGMSTAVHADGRIALVIGNSAYRNVSKLGNPANDAADVSQSLRRLGFEVTTVSDAGFDDFRRALIEFGRAARNADMAALFFGGHGVEIMGENWLLPIDADLKSDIDVNTEAINLRSAIQAVSNAKRLGLVILDACRNNPFAGKIRRPGPAATLDTGLAPVEPGENVLVAYAARDGTVAADGTGRNSPYAAALLRHLETPGLEIEFLFRNVRDDVMTATNEEQQPFVYGSLSREEIYLKEPPLQQVASVQTEVMSDASEIAWSFLKGTSDVGTLRRFVDQFPSSGQATAAKARIASLESMPSLTLASDQVYAMASAEFDTLTRQTARPFIKNTPAVETAWSVVKESKDASVIKRFVEQFPNRQRQVAAEQRLIEIGETPTIPRDLLSRAATDPDVIQCYRANDPAASECERAVKRFPSLRSFVLDFRFRYEFCQVLGEVGRCKTAVSDVWFRPLFHRKDHHDRHHGSNHAGGSRPWKHDSHAGSHSKDKSSRHGDREKSSRRGDREKSSRRGERDKSSRRADRDKSSRRGNKENSSRHGDSNNRNQKSAKGSAGQGNRNMNSGNKGMQNRFSRDSGFNRQANANSMKGSQNSRHSGGGGGGGGGRRR